MSIGHRYRGYGASNRFEAGSLQIISSNIPLSSPRCFRLIEGSLLLLHDFVKSEAINVVHSFLKNTRCLAANMWVLLANREASLNMDRNQARSSTTLRRKQKKLHNPLNPQLAFSSR
jgi:hypothetical protein